MSSLVLNKNWFLIKFFSPLILCAMSPSRYFGSTCFVHNLGPKKDNLDPHTIKFVSFGYSRTLKGYKCYGPSLCYHFVSAYVSADVTFFKSLSSLRKEVLLNSTPWFIVIPTSLSLSFHLFLMIPLLLPAVMSLFTYIGYSLYLGIHLLIASWVYHASTFYSSNWRFHSGAESHKIFTSLLLYVRADARVPLLILFLLIYLMLNSLIHQCLQSSLSSISPPNTVQEALTNPG